jgi:hypothetical protein
MEATVSAPRGDSPRTLALDIFSPGRAHVDLALTKIVINPNLSERLFEVQPPAHYTLTD